MDLVNLAKDAKVKKVLQGSSVSSTALAATSCVVMDNYNSVVFMAGGLWTSGAGHLFKLQKCATSTGGTPVDLSGATCAVINGHQSAIINLGKPRQDSRFIRGVYIKAAAASQFDDVWAIQYNGRKRGNINTSNEADNGVGATISVISPSS